MALRALKNIFTEVYFLPDFLERVMAAFCICVLTFNGVFLLSDLRDLCFVNLALFNSAGTELQLFCVLASKLICGYTRFGCRGSQRVGGEEGFDERLLENCFKKNKLH